MTELAHTLSIARPDPRDDAQALRPEISRSWRPYTAVASLQSRTSQLLPCADRTRWSSPASPRN